MDVAVVSLTYQVFLLILLIQKPLVPSLSFSFIRAWPSCTPIFLFSAPPKQSSGAVSGDILDMCHLLDKTSVSQNEQSRKAGSIHNCRERSAQPVKPRSVCAQITPWGVVCIHIHKKNL